MFAQRYFAGRFYANDYFPNGADDPIAPGGGVEQKRSILSIGIGIGLGCLLLFLISG